MTVRDSSSGPLFVGLALLATGLVVIVALHLFVASSIVRLAQAWHRGQPRR